MKITENIKAPKAFLIERGGQQTDHKAAHSCHSDGASKRMQGSLSFQEQHQSPAHQEKQENPERDIGSCLSNGGCPFRDRWEAVQTESFLLAPLPKELLSRCGEFGMLGRDLQKHGLRTVIELSGLTSSSGDGR